MILALIQARMGSTRLPKKMAKEIEGKTVIEHMINLVKKSKKIEKIVLATSTNKADDFFIEIAKNQGIELFRGSENDVLSRLYLAAKKYNAEIVVRICADNPFLDFDAMDKMISELIEKSYDYVTNAYPGGAPSGTLSEVFSFKALEKTFKEAKKENEREHVNPYIRENPKMFKIRYAEVPKWLQRPDIRLTYDTEKDLELIKLLYKKFYKNGAINLKEIIDFLDKNPELIKMNQ